MATPAPPKHPTAVYVEALYALDRDVPPCRRRTLVLDQGVLRVTWYTPQQITTVQLLRQQGWTYAQICTRTGWSISAVRYMARMALVEPDPRQEAATAPRETSVTISSPEGDGPC